MYTLNTLLLNVTGLNSAVKRTCVLEYLHRKSISGALICNTASSGIFSSCVLGVSCCHGSVDACRPGFVFLTADWLLCWYKCVSSWCWFWSLYKLNTKEKAVSWFCGCEEDNDAELVCAARVWRGILDCILLLLLYFNFYFYFLHMWLYKGRTCFVVTFSLPLSLPFDCTFKIWSVCLLLCFVCFEWTLCCDVVCEKKKKVDNKKRIVNYILRNSIEASTESCSYYWLNINAHIFPASQWPIRS